MDNLAFLFSGCRPVSQDQFLAWPDSHGQRDQRAMRVDLQRVCIFSKWQVAFELRASLNRNAQQNALRAAIISRVFGKSAGHEGIQLTSEGKDGEILLNQRDESLTIFVISLTFPRCRQPGSIAQVLRDGQLFG